jgi:zinc protease
MNKILRAISLLMFLLCLQIIAPDFCFAQTELEEPLPKDPAVRIGKLSNGLTYYIRKNSRPENKMELRLVINAGSILEEDSQQGLAHFTEHMAFNGSKNFKKNDLVSFLQTIGVEFGADLNAYTSFDETVYILPIPTEKKENVEKGFQILEDWAGSVTFNQGELDKERSVVLEEERLGKGADERMFRVTYAKIFEGSKYALRLPIGKASVLEKFKRERITQFYADWYRPDLMAVIAVGDYNPDDLEVLVKRHFSSLKNPAKERIRTIEQLKPRTKSEGLVVTDKEATNHIVEIYYNNKKDEPVKTIGDFRAYQSEILMKTMLSQRMQELTQKSDPPYLFGVSSMSGLARGYEGFSSFAYVSKGGVEPALKALIRENERARKFGFTSTELERVKKSLMKNIERSYNERDKTESSGYTDEYINNFLEDEAIPGIEKEYDYYKKYLDGITLEEVNTVAAKLIPPVTNPALFILTGPDSASFKLPTGEDLLRISIEASHEEIKPYEDKIIASALLSQIPKPGKIVSETKNEKLGTTDLLLSNGVRVVLKPTDFKNDQVVMAGSRLGGQYLYDTADRFNAEYASTVVSQMGAGGFSPFDLRKVLAGKNASVNFRIGSVSESISGQSSAVDIESLLQLMYLYFTQPRKDPELFESFITKQQTYYENMAHDPEYVFQDSVFRILYGRQPWAPQLPTVKNFSKIDLNRAIQIYKERFDNAYGFVIVIAGKFDVATIKPLLETYAGSLPSKESKPFFKDAGLRPVKGNIRKEIKKGTEPKSIVKLYWNGEAKYTEAEQLKLQAFAEVMNIKLTEKLREELGNIYSGGIYASLNKYPYNNYSVVASIPCGPENVSKVIKALHEEISKIKKNGPEEKDLDKVKETWRQQYLVNMKENGFWVRQLLQNLENGNDPTRIFDTEKEINALTVGQIRDASNQYLGMKNYVEIVLNPE